MHARSVPGREVIHSMVVLMVVAGLLMLFGCGTDGGRAAPGDLENRTFTFSNGAAFGLTGQAIALSFGDFGNDGDGNPNTGPVTLQVSATGGRATGTATVGSLTVTFSESQNIPEIPSGTAFSFDLTLAVDGSIDLTNTASALSSSSAPPDPIPTTNVAFVITTDFSTGSYSVVDLASQNTFDDIGLVHSDAMARFFNGLVYVINRFGADNIQILDPQQGFTTVAQESMGPGSNPQDIAVVSSAKAYVSRLGSKKLLIVDPTTLAEIGTIDLSDRTRPNDLDGVPELFRMLVHNGRVYLLLQHLDFSGGGIPAKAGPGEVVVIDAATDAVVAVIALQGENPNTDLQFSPDLNRILVGSVGDFLVNDGGIEAIDPATNTVDAGFVIGEAAIGGDITHFRVVSATKGFAIITDANFANTLVTFNPSTGQKIRPIFGPVNVFVPHFAINRRHELYLAVTDTTTPTPGLRIFDTVQDVELTSEPLRVGQLPPFHVLFIED